MGGGLLSRPETILFDAGGTLVLQDPAEMSRRLGHPIDPHDAHRIHYQVMAEFSELLTAGQRRTWDWWLERYFERLGVPDPAAAGRKLDGGFGLWTLAIDGTIAALTELSAMGIRLGVVSNSDGSVRASLSAAGFDGLLEVVLDSAEEGVKKPDPAIFTSALRRLGAQASTCWHVGDSLHHDVEGALAAGLSRALLVDPYRLAPRGTDRVDSCADLPGLVKGARPA